MDIAFLVKQPRVLDQMDEGFDELMSAAHAGKAPATSASRPPVAPEPIVPAPNIEAAGEQAAESADDTVFGIELLLEDDDAE